MFGKIKLSGVTFGDCQENINKYGHRDIRYFSLVREPNNQFDSNAVWVGLGPWKFGYIPKEIAREIAPLMDNGTRFEAELVTRNESPVHDTVGLTIKLLQTESISVENGGN